MHTYIHTHTPCKLLRTTARIVSSALDQRRYKQCKTALQLVCCSWPAKESHNVLKETPRLFLFVALGVANPGKSDSGQVTWRRGGAALLPEKRC